MATNTVLSNGLNNHLTLLLGVLKTFQQSACDGELLRMECPPDTLIYVHHLEYLPQSRPRTSRAILNNKVNNNNSGTQGTIQRPEQHVCGAPTVPPSSSNKSHSVLVSTPEFADDDVLCGSIEREKLQESLRRKIDMDCQRKNKCSVGLTPNSLTRFEQGTDIGDLCPNRRKLAVVAYKCRPEKFINKIACENETISLSCAKDDANLRLAILVSTFGASADEIITECHEKILEMQSQHPDREAILKEKSCISSHSTERTINRCHGQKQCKFSATIESLGNPHCQAGIVTRAKIVYACVPDRAFTESHLKATGRNQSKLLASSKDYPQRIKDGKDANLRSINGNSALYPSNNSAQQFLYNQNITKQQVETRPLMVTTGGEVSMNKNKFTTDPKNVTIKDLTRPNETIKLDTMSVTKEQTEVHLDNTIENSIKNYTTAILANNTQEVTPHISPDIDVVPMNSLSDSSSSMDMQMDGIIHDGVLNHYIAAARSIEQASMTNLSANLIGSSYQQPGQSSTSNTSDIGQRSEILISSSEPPPKFKVVGDTILIDGRKYRPSEARKHHNMFTWFSDKWSDFTENIRREYATTDESFSSHSINDNSSSGQEINTRNLRDLDLYRFIMMVIKVHREFLYGLGIVILIITVVIYRRHNSNGGSSKRSASGSISPDDCQSVDLTSSRNKRTNLRTENGSKRYASSRWFKSSSNNKNNKVGSSNSDSINKTRPLSLIDNSSEHSNSLNREYCDQTDDDGFDTGSHTCQHNHRRKAFHTGQFNTIRPAMVDMNDYFMSTSGNNDDNIIENNNIHNNNNYTINNNSVHDSNSLATSMTVTSASTYATPIPVINAIQPHQHTITFCNHHHNNLNLNHHIINHQLEDHGGGNVNQILLQHQPNATIIPNQSQTMQTNHNLLQYHQPNHLLSTSHYNTLLGGMDRTISNTEFSTESTALAPRCCSVAMEGDEACKLKFDDFVQ